MTIDETTSEGPDGGVRALLRLLVPKEMADDIEACGACDDDLEFVAEQITMYLQADPEARADMLAFHRSGGIRTLIRRAVERDEGCVS